MRVKGFRWCRVAPDYCLRNQGQDLKIHGSLVLAVRDRKEGREESGGRDGGEGEREVYTRGERKVND